jgi:hypothetical protein
MENKFLVFARGNILEPMADRKLGPASYKDSQLYSFQGICLSKKMKNESNIILAFTLIHGIDYDKQVRILKLTSLYS